MELADQPRISFSETVQYIRVLASESPCKGSDARFLFGSLSSHTKDEVQRVIPVGWRQEGHPATKTLLQFLFIHGYLWMTTKMGGVQPVVPRGQPHLPARNRMMGNPAQLQDRISVIMKAIDLMPCREAGGGTEKYF